MTNKQTLRDRNTILTMGTPAMTSAQTRFEQENRRAEAVLADSVAMSAAELIETLGTSDILKDKIERRAEIIARNVLANLEGEARKMAVDAIRAKVMERVASVKITITIGGDQ